MDELFGSYARTRNQFSWDMVGWNFLARPYWMETIRVAYTQESISARSMKSTEDNRNGNKTRKKKKV
ncbi:hypothetical protein BLOT_004698 [Blomia tropicalis]|nr:hypothetical protein BLOT_004698 [Blomia tropicalis]